MATVSYIEHPKSGFSFLNCARNELIQKTPGVQLPKAKKTGTTIVGICYKDGVILGADTRATEDTIVAEKNCAKIHHITKNIQCCGAGTSADTNATTRLVSHQLALLELNTGRQSRVSTACVRLQQFLFKYQGHISAALVLGGVDVTGPHLYHIYPHGSAAELPFVTMGSGSLAAMSVFDSGFKPNMEKEAALALVSDAVEAGIVNDLGSGSNIDVCVIGKDSVEHIRGYKQVAAARQRDRSYLYGPGTTKVLRELVTPVKFDIVSEKVLSTDETMETS